MHLLFVVKAGIFNVGRILAEKERHNIVSLSQSKHMHHLTST